MSSSQPDAPTRHYLQTYSGAALFVVTLTLLFTVLAQCVVEWPPPLRYRLSSDSGDLKLLWERELVLPGADNLAADGNALLVHDYSIDALVALDVQDGRPTWESLLLGVNRAYMRIFVDGDTAYTVHVCCVTAYSMLNGLELWNTSLEGGKVMLGSSVTPDSIQVYYENLFFVVSKRTGAVVSVQPRDELIWVVGDLAIFRDEIGMHALERTSGTTIWRTIASPFRIRAAPVGAGEDKLLVNPEASRETCMLDLSTGEYSWCYAGGFESDVAVDSSQSRGYFVDDTFKLIALDLVTGETRALGSFELDRPAPPEGLPTNLTGIAAESGRIFVQFATTNQLLALAPQGE